MLNKGLKNAFFLTKKIVIFITKGEKSVDDFFYLLIETFGPVLILQ